MQHIRDDHIFQKFDDFFLNFGMFLVVNVAYYLDNYHFVERIIFPVQRHHIAPERFQTNICSRNPRILATHDSNQSSNVQHMITEDGVLAIANKDSAYNHNNFLCGFWVDRISDFVCGWNDSGFIFKSHVYIFLVAESIRLTYWRIHDCWQRNIKWCREHQQNTL